MLTWDGRRAYLSNQESNHIIGANPPSFPQGKKHKDDFEKYRKETTEQSCLSKKNAIQLFCKNARQRLHSELQTFSGPLVFYPKYISHLWRFPYPCICKWKVHGLSTQYCGINFPILGLHLQKIKSHTFSPRRDAYTGIEGCKAVENIYMEGKESRWQGRDVIFCNVHNVRCEFPPLRSPWERSITRTWLTVEGEVSKLAVPTIAALSKEQRSTEWSAEQWVLPYASSYLLVFRARNATLKIALINPFGTHAATVFGRMMLPRAFSFLMHIMVSEVKMNSSVFPFPEDDKLYILWQSHSLMFTQRSPRLTSIQKPTCGC